MKIIGTNWVIVLAILTASLFPGSGFAKTGEVVSVTQPAQVRQNGEIRRLAVGDRVATGDTVATGQDGQIQLLFPDETKIVVGPRSQLKIHKLLFKNEKTAKRFHVRAISGTFRLLTGNSPKRAYSVRTPTASMAVRGTQFDFNVADRLRDTTLVVLGGAVNLCAAQSRCVVVGSGCQMAAVSQTQSFSQPRTLADRNSILQRLFPFAVNEESLPPAFRVDENPCADKRERKDKPPEQVILRQLTLPPPLPATGAKPDPKPGRDNPAE